MPTWLMPLWKNTRSPSWRADLAAERPRLYCCPAECGRLTPTEPQAFIVRPEQSHELGPAALRTYGSPSCAFANASALTPLLLPLTGPRAASREAAAPAALARAAALFCS